MDRDDALQIYYLSLLKPWRKAVPVAKLIMVPKRVKMRLGVNLTAATQYMLEPTLQEWALFFSLSLCPLLNGQSIFVEILKKSTWCLNLMHIQSHM